MRERSTAGRIIAAMDLDNVPWNLAVSAILGLWIMAAPAVLGATGATADSDHLVGALIVTWAVIAFGEISRPVRLVNVLLGLWLIAAPWILDGGNLLTHWSGVFAGILLVALSIPRGRIHERFDTWNRYLL